MRTLNFQLKQLCHRNRDGSFQTRANRAKMLQQMANQLQALGFRRMHLTGLKPKHITALVDHWQQQGIAPGTLKNRMTALRWWAEKINKHNLIAQANSHYGIANRQYISQDSKAQTLTVDTLDRISDPAIRISLELQQTFGLRREEAIKFCPAYADLGDRIQLKASWTKGGRARDIPLRTQHQRDILDRAHQLAGNGSLIPPERRYSQQLRVYEYQTARAGLSKLHGLRHQYAQTRYEELTGWKAPAAGGPRRQQLNAAQKAQDRAARLIISRELGHARVAIAAIYLSK